MSEDLSTPHQPVSSHENTYSYRGALPIITALLGVFLVLETIAFSYLVMVYVGVRNIKDDFSERRQELAEQVQERKSEILATQPPLLYSLVSPEGDENIEQATGLYAVSRSTGRENLIYQAESGFISLMAIPQIGYDGRVFFHESCAGCDDPYLHMFEFTVGKNDEPKAVEFADILSYPQAVKVSPDQTSLAVVHYDDVEVGHGGSIYIVDLLSGERQKLGELAEDEYFSENFGDNVFGVTNGFTLNWQNRSCFTVNIYQESGNSAKAYLEQRTYCSA